MKEKMTLFELLYNDEREIILSMKKIKLYSLSSDSDYVYMEEYFLADIPYYLLRKEVINAVYYKNTIEIFIKWKVGKRKWKKNLHYTNY